jgi:transmembrane sensor
VSLPDDNAGASAASVIEQLAAEWLVRVDAQPNPDTWGALDRWLSANPRHRLAFLRQSVAWRRSDTLRQLRPLDGKVDPDLLTPAGYRTNEGQPNTVVLPDGSTMWLRPESEIRVVAWQGGQRRLRLLYGEALFRVRAHASAPFEVEAFGTRVGATGTLFGVSVLRSTASVEVRVASGQVEVRPTLQLDDESPAASRTITAGLKATVSGSSIAVASAPIRETLRAFGWRLLRH